MATILGRTDSSNWTYKIDVYDISTNVEDISSVMRVDVYIGRENSKSYLGGTFSGHVSINWETPEQVTEPFSGTIPYPTNINAGAWYHIATKDFYVKHNTTGDKTIRVVSELTQTQFNPHYASADGWVELTNIAVKTVAPDITGLIGSTYNISLSPTSNAFRHSLCFWFGGIKEKWLQPDGSLGDTEYIFPTSNTSPVFTVPKSFYKEFTSYSAQGAYRVYTYNNDIQLGYDEGLLDIRCSGQLCSPKITSDTTALDVNPVTVALTHNPNNIIRYASNVEITPVIIPSDPDDTDTTIISKFVNSIPFEGDSVVINNVSDKSYVLTANNSRGMPSLPTTVSVKGSMIPYISLSFNIVSLKRTEPTTGEVEIEYNGNYYDGEFTEESVTSENLYIGNELLYENIICSFPDVVQDETILQEGTTIVASTNMYNLFYSFIAQNLGGTLEIGLENKETKEVITLYYANNILTTTPNISINSSNLIINTSFGIIESINNNDKVVYPYIKKVTTQDAVYNELNIRWKYRAEGEDTYTEGGTLTPDIDKTTNTYSGKTSLGKIFDYRKRYEIVFECTDKINTESKSGMVSRGFPVFWWTEDSFHILGDLYINDEIVSPGGNNNGTTTYNNIYSDQEVVIGVWAFNNKPVYRKMVSVNFSTSESVTKTPHGISNLGYVITQRLTWFDVTDNAWYEHDKDAGLNSFFIKIDNVDAENITIKQNNYNWQDRTINRFCILEYIKTTDNVVTEEDV